MSQQTLRTVLASAAIIAGLGVIAYLTRPPAATSATGTTKVVLRGVVRDFVQAHPDFGITDMTVRGHVVDGVGLRLGSRNVPDLSGGGRLVSDQWVDGERREIPPHLALFATGTPDGNVVRVATGPSFTNASRSDTYDSDIGPYGGANVGPEPVWQTGSTLIEPTIPIDLPKRGGYERASDVVDTLAESFRCDDFVIKDRAILWISGDVTIVARNKFVVQNESEIRLEPNSTLTVYSLGDTVFQDRSEVNTNTAEPWRVKVYHLGSGNTFKLQNRTPVHAHLASVKDRLLLQDDSQLFGRYTGRGVDLQNGSAYHHDLEGGDRSADICGSPSGDVAGAAGKSMGIGATSAETFGEWFEDRAGVNLSNSLSIELERVGGMFRFSTERFNPIDGQLLGNEGRSSNYFFTYVIDAQFEFEACAEQYIAVSGGDGLWVYVDDQLGVDLGGLASGQPQRLDFDRLELDDGRTYSIRIFYAQRSAAATGFSIETNVRLLQPGAFALGTEPFD